MFNKELILSDFKSRLEWDFNIHSSDELASKVPFSQLLDAVY